MHVRFSRCLCHHSHAFVFNFYDDSMDFLFFPFSLAHARKHAHIHRHRTRLIILNQWLNLVPSYFQTDFPPNHQKSKKKELLLSISHNTVCHCGAYICVCVCILCKFKIETTNMKKRIKMLCDGIEMKYKSNTQKNATVIKWYTFDLKSYLMPFLWLHFLFRLFFACIHNMTYRKQQGSDFFFFNFPKTRTQDSLWKKNRNANFPKQIFIFCVMRFARREEKRKKRICI